MKDEIASLLEEVIDEALEIGSDNWDSYLAPNRRPTIEESPKYKRLKQLIAEL